MDGYERVNIPDLHVGDVIIYEQKHFDYKKGFPVESDYYRAVVGEHRTVAGMAFHLTNEPNVEWPQVAPWYSHWIYAENGGTCQMWRKKDE